MKIMICGSMTFASEMLRVQSILTTNGHVALVPSDTQNCVDNPHHIDDLDADRKYCIESDIMRECMRKIEEADAVLVLNYEKNGIKGYVGTAALMELGLAHYFKKRIFLLHEVPDPRVARWAHEVLIFQPEIIHGDLEKIQ
jgi:nucleoside 2-deoxyribosyltransferase